MIPNSCSSPSMQQQQQGPPPPYGVQPMSGSGGKSKLQKAGVPEKFDKMQAGVKSEQDMFMLKNSGGGITTSGLQTTPSPQLMSYMEFEGQELTITKQLNTSYKGNIGDESGAPSNANSVILNILNTSSGGGQNNSQSLNDNLLLNDDNNMKIKSESMDAANLLGEHLNGNSDLSSELHLNQQNNPASSQQQQQQHRHHEQQQQQQHKKANLKHQNSNSQLQQGGGGAGNDLFSSSPSSSSAPPNPSQSPMGLVNGAPGPLTSMLQMTNSIPKASPYASTAKSPGLNHHAAFGGQPPQMSSSPSPMGMGGMPPQMMNKPGGPMMMPHEMMMQQQQQQQQQPPGLQSIQQPPPPAPTGKQGIYFNC